MKKLRAISLNEEALQELGSLIVEAWAVQSAVTEMETYLGRPERESERALISGAHAMERLLRRLRETWSTLTVAGEGSMARQRAALAEDLRDAFSFQVALEQLAEAWEVEPDGRSEAMITAVFAVTRLLRLAVSIDDQLFREQESPREAA